jgi:xylulokinase
VLTGGATRSAYWNQLQADILGREVVVPEVADGAFGMAVVAASTEYGSLKAAAERMVRVRDRLIPREGVSERFVSPYAALVRELAGRGWIGERLEQSALAGLGVT